MKRSIILISISLILLIGAVWLIFQKREIASQPQVEKSSAVRERVARESEPTEELDKEKIVKKIKRNDELKLEEEAAQIRDDLFKAASINDKKTFGARMIDLMDRFTGDPRPILHDLTPFLQHENESIAGAVASAFLRSRTATDEATACLLKIMARLGPLIEPKTEEDSYDIRLGVASILSQYPSQEISDAVWKLYERTKEKRLFDELLRLKNPKLPEEIIPLLKEHGAVFDYIGIVNEYKIQEAIEPLLKAYANKYFMRKGDGPKRGATLWGLWRLTGDQKYHDEYIAAGGGTSVDYLANEGTVEAKDRLVALLKVKSYSNTVDEIVMALHLKYGDPPELKKYLRDIYLSKKASDVSYALLYRLTSAINDSELDALAEKSYSDSEGPGTWRQYGVYRKGWAIPEWAGGALDIP